MSENRDIVVFCHLRWNFVWQRPQHIMSRLARAHRVFYIEEPVQDENAEPHWRVSEPSPNLYVCTPVTSFQARGFHATHVEELRPLIEDLIASKQIENYVVWSYTPMAVPLLESLNPDAVVYDCMDELSAFLHAPPELLELEKQLLVQAHLVFTGGPSLFRAKTSRHSSVHCFSSSVDAAHFARAKQSLPDPPDQAQISHPRFGFFGVVDERFDVALLAELASRRPEWQFVIVGPIVKIDPAKLPRSANIHYLGQRSYEDLPAFLSGWDVCLLLFAKNEATRFISPTKTLEYMAAEKPIVSTSITDVIEPYGDIVYVGDTVDEFEVACDQALNQSEGERESRIQKMRDVLRATSWDRTVADMDALMTKAAAVVVNQRRGSDSRPRKTGSQGKSSHSDSLPDNVITENESDVSEQSPSFVEPTVVVIGAGPTGLSAAFHLGEDALLLERNDTVGGWCRSTYVNGFTFDFAGHIMFSNDPYVHKLYAMLLGDNLHWQDREAWIYSKSVYTRYPFQGALYGLPPSVIKECLIGAIEARFGPLSSGNADGPAKAPTSTSNNHNGSSPASVNGHATANGQACVNGANSKSQLEDCCADGILESSSRLGEANVPRSRHTESNNFEEFIYNVWGSGIAKHFAIPYNRKLWAVPLTEMETSWLGGRVPLPDLGEMIEGALQPVAKPMGPNARFGYPLIGGFQALMDGFLPHLKGPLQLNADVRGFAPSRREITLADGSIVNYRYLISTMPLPVLVRLAGDEAPAEVREAVAGLRYISVRCVNLGIGREAISDKHWIYYPEDTIFHRIFVQGNASPLCNPPGGFGLTCEITYREETKPLPCEGEELIARCIEDCRRVGIIDEKDEIWAQTEVDMPHAYVLYDHARAKNVAIIRDWLAKFDVILAGRYSEWEYYNSDHAFLAGKKAAEQVQAKRAARVRQPN